MPPKRQQEAKKGRWDLLKHPLLVAVVAATIGLTAVYLKSSSVKSMTNNANTANSNKVNIGGDNYGQIAGGNIMNQTVVSQPAQTNPTIEEQINFYAKAAASRHWQPPELPKGILGISIDIGDSVRLDYDMSRLTTDKDGVPNGVPLVVFPGGSPVVKPYVKNNRLYVLIDTPFGDAEKTVQMNNEWDSVIPTGWDRNFNSNMFEIVDNQKLPILQVKYVTAFEMQVHGIFVSENGGVAVAFGDGIAYSSPGYPTIPKIPERKAWFKYPSTNFLSELVSQ